MHKALIEEVIENFDTGALSSLVLRPARTTTLLLRRGNLFGLHFFARSHVKVIEGRFSFGGGDWSSWLGSG